MCTKYYGICTFQHLNQLKTAGILSSEKQGMNVIYQIQDERIIALIEVIKELYCSDSQKET